MRLTMGLLVGACAASIAANAWQLASRASGEPQAVPLVDTSHRKQTTGGSTSARPQLPSNDQPHVAVPPDIAKLDRAALEQRLAKAEARLDAALPLQERFDFSPPSPENEARVRPIFDRVFQATSGEQPLYSLECHGPVCRLETSVSANDWQYALRAEEDAIFSSMQVGQQVSYVRLEEPGRAAGMKYSKHVIMELLGGSATSECKKRNPAQGTVELSLHFDVGSRKVSVASSGALANEAVGVCLRRVLEDIVERTPIPPEMTAVVEEPITVRVP